MVKRTISKFYYLTFSIFLILFLTTFWSTLKPYYYFQYEHNAIMQVTGLDAEGIDIAIDRLTGYLSEKYPELNAQVNIHGQSRLLFNEREILHMKDVRYLISMTRKICGAYGISLILYYLLLKKKDVRREFLRKLGRGAFLGVLVVIGLSVGAILVDFTNLFIKFHEIFFTNDLWLLDPRTDVLIQMLPEVFFRDIVLAIFANALVISGVFNILGVKKWSKS